MLTPRLFDPITEDRVLNDLFPVEERVREREALQEAEEMTRAMLGRARTKQPYTPWLKAK